MMEINSQSQNNINKLTNLNSQLSLKLNDLLKNISQKSFENSIQEEDDSFDICSDDINLTDVFINIYQDTNKLKELNITTKYDIVPNSSVCATQGSIDNV